MEVCKLPFGHKVHVLAEWSRDGGSPDEPAARMVCGAVAIDSYQDDRKRIPVAERCRRCFRKPPRDR